MGVYSKRYTLFIVLTDSQEATDNKLILHKNPVFYTEKLQFFTERLKRCDKSSKYRNAHPTSYALKLQ